MKAVANEPQASTMLSSVPCAPATPGRSWVCRLEPEQRPDLPRPSRPGSRGRCWPNSACPLPPSVEIKVLGQQRADPLVRGAGAAGRTPKDMSETELAALVTPEAMMGVAVAKAA